MKAGIVFICMHREQIIIIEFVKSYIFTLVSFVLILELAVAAITRFSLCLVPTMLPECPQLS